MNSTLSVSPAKKNGEQNEPTEELNRPSFINNDESDNISSDSYEEIIENNAEHYRMSPKSPTESMREEQKIDDEIN